jgi:2-hydroxychromene-2-carboxylate isomerase
MPKSTLKREKMPDPIEFFFDFSSPYGYIASHKIDEIAANEGRETRWKPIMLGPAFKVTGNRPIIEQSIKGEYAVKDCERFARYMKIPWVLPDPFPIATVSAARGFYWLDDNYPALAKPFAKAAFHAYFGDGRDISAPGVAAEVAAGIGVDAEEFEAAIASPSIKARLRREVESSLERGVFGSPFIIVDGEAFWGADRLWMVKKWLRSGGW